MCRPNSCCDVNFLEAFDWQRYNYKRETYNKKNELVVLYDQGICHAVEDRAGMNSFSTIRHAVKQSDCIVVETHLLWSKSESRG